MKKIISFLLITSCCFAQNQNNVWCFGDSAGMNFNSDISSTFSSPVYNRVGLVSIADSIGKPYFVGQQTQGGDIYAVKTKLLHHLSGDAVATLSAKRILLHYVRKVCGVNPLSVVV